MKESSNTTVIRIKGLRFAYEGTENPVLDGIDLEIKEGEFVLITGPSGSGKSTLARIITGLIPNSYPGELLGEVYIMGLDPRRNKIYEIAQYVGMVLQNPENQLFALTVEDDVAFGPENFNLEQEEIKERVNWSLQVTGLEKERYKAPFELSGGLQQRAAIAGVLAMKPRILILDEPTSYMDPITSLKFANFLNGLRTDLKLTILLIEQKVELFFKLVDRIIVMDNGKIVINDEPIKALEYAIERKLPVNIPLQVLLLKKVYQRVDKEMMKEEKIEDYKRILEKLIK